MGPTGTSALPWDGRDPTPLGPHLDREGEAVMRIGKGRPGLASLPGCTGPSTPYPVVSLRSTTGYPMGCLWHPCEGRPAIRLMVRTIPEGFEPVAGG